MKKAYYLLVLMMLSLSIIHLHAAESTLIPIPNVTNILFFNNETFFVGTDEKKVIRYCLAKQAIEKEKNTECFHSLRLNSDKTKLAGINNSLSYICTIFCATSLDELQRLDLNRPYYDFIESCAFSNVENNVLFLSWTKAIEKYNIQTKTFDVINYNSIAYNKQIAIHPSKNTLYVASGQGSDNGGVAIYDCDTSPIKIKYIPFIVRSFPFACICNNDGSSLALNDVYNEIRIVNSSNDRVMQMPRIGIIKSFAFHPIKKNVLAILDIAKRIKLIYWNIQTQREEGEQTFSASLWDEAKRLENVAFSLDGRRIIIGFKDYCEVINSLE